MDLNNEGGRSLAEEATVVERVIPLSSPQEWKQALSGIPHSFFHTWEHSYAMHLTHKLPAFLYCAEADGVRVVCPFIERPIGPYADIATPYGFSGFTGNGVIPGMPMRWREFAAQRGYITTYIILHPLFFRDSYAPPDETYPLKTVYVIDSALDIGELWRRCSESRRRTLRRWQAGDFAVVTDRHVLSEFFLANYREFFRRKQATSAYDFSPFTMRFLLSLSDVIAIGVAKGRNLEAVHLSVCTPYAAEYLFNVSLPGAQYHSAGLIWEALAEIQRRGIQFLNLGGGLLDHDNLEEFKRRFGANRYDLKALKQVFAPERYAELCARCGASSEARDGYFPAYRTSTGENAPHV